MYRRICVNKPPILRTNFINAEIAKIGINSYITMKITFANMLAEICERVPGADVDEVTRILGSDSRIGPKYLRGGLGYGGPCFPRDNLAFARFAEEVGFKAELPLTVHSANLRQIDRVLWALKRLHVSPPNKIGILGLSYKPDTNVIEESQGLLLAKRLCDMGFDVVVYDPAAIENARQVLGNSVVYASTLEEAVSSSDVLIIATPWKEFSEIDVRGKTVIDCWRILKGKGTGQGFRYVPLGVHTP